MAGATPHPSLSFLDHRPWPLPRGEWAWRQSWCDLLFAHWPAPVEVLRPLVPRRLEIDRFDNTAWVALVPFRMADVARRPLPAMPGLRAFPELNVRTYVTEGGKPGVWFFSLDAAHLIAVAAARRMFHLPYVWAKMHCDAAGDSIDFQSERRGRGASRFEFRASYKPEPAILQTHPGSLEHWLTERYCLYAESPTGKLFRTEVHHQPWPLQPATAELRFDLSESPLARVVNGPPELLHFSRRLDVVAWNPRVIG